MSPSVLRAPAGEVTFVNRDEITHNVIGDGWGDGELKAGESYKRAFGDGTHLFSCTLHPGMLGAVVVGDGEGEVTPIAASSPSDGSKGGNGGALALGLAVGAVLGAITTLGARRLVRTSAAA